MVVYRNSLAYQKYLNSPAWETIRLRSIAYHCDREGKVHCYACGRLLLGAKEPVNGSVNIHHVRYPDPTDSPGDFIVARDTMPVCRKCHDIISSTHALADDPDISKRGLARGVREVYHRRKAARVASKVPA